LDKEAAPSRRVGVAFAGIGGSVPKAEALLQEADEAI
jgi:hypothetical protein